MVRSSEYEMQQSLPADVRIMPELYQQKAFIDRAIENVMEALRDGAVLVVVILFLFLMNVRTTLITLTAIPLSVVLTAMVFAACAQSSIGRCRLGSNYEVSEHGKVVSWKGAHKLIGARRRGGKTGLTSFSWSQQRGIGDNIGVPGLDPVAVSARLRSSRSHIVLGPGLD